MSCNLIGKSSGSEDSERFYNGVSFNDLFSICKSSCESYCKILSDKRKKK